MPSNPYSVTGVDWLKPPTCGGLAGNPAKGFVPCSFTGGRLAPAFSTTITQTPATNTIEARTSFFVPKLGANPKNVGVVAAKVADAAMAQQTSPANGTFFMVYANTPVTANAPVSVSAVNPTDRGRVLVIENNAPSNDVFLRTDGTNSMLADLNVGGHSLANAKNGEFNGDLRVKGTSQIDGGLSVTAGTADLRGGVIAPDVQVTSVGHNLSQALYNATVYTGQTSYQVPKPDCTQANLGASSPGIYATMQATGTPATSGADALYDSHVQVTDMGTYWTVVPVVRSTTFSLNGSSTADSLTIQLNKTVSTANVKDMAIMVMTKCK
jgi:hypothetical protein